MSDRIPCINPRCRRTAPADKHEPGVEIVCGKCWRSLPRAMRDRRSRLERLARRLGRLAERRLAAGTITGAAVARIMDNADRVLWENWLEIRRYFNAPEKPAGLDAFLEEMGFAPDPLPSRRQACGGRP